MQDHFPQRSPVTTGREAFTASRARDDATRPVGPPVHAGRPKSALPSRRILIVDDTRAAAFMLGKLLEALGQQVQIVVDGQTALASVLADPPEMIISDIAMPGMSGYELARRLRSEVRLKDTLLVALTGFNQESDREETRAAGFDRHLVKPVSLDALRELLA
jgi:CheY-like chemotaxis protein